MNNKFTFLICPIVAFGLLLTGCKKEDAVQNDSISGRYQLTGVKKVIPQGEVDEFPFLEDCAKDDVLEFKSNKTYVYTDAGEKCNPAGDDQGQWIQKSSTVLEIDGLEAIIVSNSNGQLVLMTSEAAGAETIRYKMTYKKL
jgi:hypothetical protein